MIIDKNVKECYLYRTCSSMKFRKKRNLRYTQENKKRGIQSK